MINKVNISARALIQRLNRKLAPNKVIKSNRRSDRLTEEMGAHYVLDLKAGRVAERHVDLAALGKKLGVMESWEQLADI